MAEVPPRTEARLYEEHFGLGSRPFGDPSESVALPSRESALRRLRYGVEHGQGPALLFGPAGTGKTHLARELARALDVPWCHLVFPAMPAAELMGMLADELEGASSPAAETVAPIGASIRRLRTTLGASAVRGVRPLLIVDEAQLIDDPATFEALRLLLNFATAGPPDLALVLVGGPEVLLRLPASLADRLTARCLLGPLTEPESAAYVEGRLAAAGASDPLFDADALRLLHRAADGLPRRLNRLADLALLVAYAEGRPRPDAQTVAIAAREATLEPLAA